MHATDEGGYRLIYELDDLGISGLFATDVLRVGLDVLDGIPALAGAMSGDAATLRRRAPGGTVVGAAPGALLLARVGVRTAHGVCQLHLEVHSWTWRTAW